MKVINVVRRLSIILLPLSLPLLALAGDESSHTAGHESHASQEWKNSPLVAKVRKATARYRNINTALAEQWIVGTPCVTGPQTGAMGIHLLKPERLNDGVLDAEQPEALIYEPLANGAYRLVGVEFIVPAPSWPKEPAPRPALDGHLLNFVGHPNRYGLPAFYEIHVWAWEKNPDGNFVDWNRQVSCDKQQAN
jgi:hypothetical protein